MSLLAVTPALRWIKEEMTSHPGHQIGPPTRVFTDSYIAPPMISHYSGPLPIIDRPSWISEGTTSSSLALEKLKMAVNLMREE
jgi:hypothetical protein